MEFGEFKAQDLLLEHVHCTILTKIINVYRESVKNSVLDVFAGPPHTGTYSPSVQVIFCSPSPLSLYIASSSMVAGHCDSEECRSYLVTMQQLCELLM